METLDKLIVFQKGTIVKHRSGWGVGKVVKIREEKMEIIVDLERKPDHRMEVLAAIDCLIPLKPDNFEAMLAFQSEFLKQEADQNPMQLIQRVLNFAEKPLGAREFRQYLSPGVIDEKNWTRWWGKTRKQLITDPYIENAPDAHNKYIIREKPRDWEEEARAGFEEAPILDRPQALIDYMKNSTTKKTTKLLC